MYLLGMTSGGFRSGELYGMQWADIDLDAAIPCVYVRRALAEKGPTGRNTLGKTKTRDAIRTNPLHRLAVRALRAWKAVGWTKLVGRKPEGTDFVFPDDKGKARRPRDADNVRSDLVAAGLPTTFAGEQLTFKDCVRHSFATWLGAAGVADEIIGRLQGHAARSVTRRHYIGDTLAPLRDAIGRIQLDASASEVVRFPFVVAANAGDPTRRFAVTAELTADLPRPAVSGRGQREDKLAKVHVFGGVAERSKAAVLKTADGASHPGVRISPPPLKLFRRARFRASPQDARAKRQSAPKKQARPRRPNSP